MRTDIKTSDKTKELLEQLAPEWANQVVRFSEERERLLEDARRELVLRPHARDELRRLFPRAAVA